MRPLHTTVFAPLLAAATLLLAIACSQPKDRFRLEGDIAGVGQAELCVYLDDGNFDGIDTIRIADGHFVYERTLLQPVVLTLLYPNFSQSYVIAEPGEVVKMKGNAAKLGEADISGTKENELLTDFRLQVAHKKTSEALLAAAQFVRANKTTLAAFAVFKKYFATAQSPDIATTRSLLADLQKAQPRNAALAAVSKQLKHKFVSTVGQTLPDFEVTTTDGRHFSKADLTGQVSLIATIASWSSESTTFQKTLHRLQRAYGSKLQLLLVALDHDRKGLDNRLRRDSLEVPVVCDGKAFDSPAAIAFGFSRVPSNLLVDSTGKIVAANLSPADLEQRVAELLR